MQRGERAYLVDGVGVCRETEQGTVIWSNRPSLRLGGLLNCDYRAICPCNSYELRQSRSGRAEGLLGQRLSGADFCPMPTGWYGDLGTTAYLRQTDIRYSHPSSDF
jgi:hypothetical protein